MGQVSSGGKGKKEVAVELNLVPVIDLMSVLITFLLITAVWTQVSMIQIGNSLYAKKNDDEPVKPPPQADIPLKLDIVETGYRLTVGSKVTSLPVINGEFNEEGLLSLLQDIKTKYPEKIDANIAMQDDLPYERLIKGMDVLLKANFTSIAVLTGGPK
jgi:biopolymer transport protein ExbD